MDPYEVLDVKKNATQIEIRDKYRELSKRYHPDKGGDTELFVKIADAWAILGDPEKRKAYDKNGFVMSGEKLQLKAEALIQQAFQALIAQAGLTGILQMDVVTEMRNLLDGGISELSGKEEGARANIRAMNKIVEKLGFKGKGKKNPILVMLEHDIAKNNATIAQCKLETMIAKKTYDIIKDYTFDFDGDGFRPVIFTPGTYTVNFGSGATGGM